MSGRADRPQHFGLFRAIRQAMHGRRRPHLRTTLPRSKSFIAPPMLCAAQMRLWVESMIGWRISEACSKLQTRVVEDHRDRQQVCSNRLTQCWIPLT